MKRLARQNVFHLALLPLATTFTGALTPAGCVSNESGKRGGAYAGEISYKVVVEGFEWGPSVTRLIVTAEDDFQREAVDTTMFVVKTTLPVDAGDPTTYIRRITDMYICDSEGLKRSSGSSKSIAFELATGYETIMTIPGVGNIGAAIDGSSPFSYNRETGYNSWADLATYTVELAEGRTIRIGAATYDAVTVAADSYAGRLAPETALFTKGAISANGDSGSITLQTAAYEPESLKKDGAKNALLIWLHGAGEGGTDIDIALLGNDVTELSKEPIQNYFKTAGADAGAYILVVQTPTMWMDNGGGQHQGDQDSRYTEALKRAIDRYIAANGDVDTDRIYIGGCSNGGYMTIDMLIKYPDFFAAAYPICEAYRDSYIDSAKLDKLKRTPLWFTASADDSVVAPPAYTARTYARLVRADAKNAHFSYFEHVTGQDQPGVVYMGHWSWIYTLQDRCVLDQNAAAIKAAANLDAAVMLVTAPSTEPVQATGGQATLWGWLAAQRKGRS
ncbi:MAG: prolyl oligopeptidase family serine peptidase [Treponema sp.]|jgi:predicted esterase|nr:prolyl oligopeptidase family serine peptidase [Treponema sp.]